MSCCWLHSVTVAVVIVRIVAVCRTVTGVGCHAVVASLQLCLLHQTQVMSTSVLPVV